MGGARTHKTRMVSAHIQLYKLSPPYRGSVRRMTDITRFSAWLDFSLSLVFQGPHLKMMFFLRFSPLLLVVDLDENGPRGEGVRHDLRPGHVSCLNWCRPRLTSGLVSVVTDMSMVAGAVTHDVTHVALVLAAARLVSVGWLRSTPRNLDFHLGRCDGRLVRVRVRVKVGVRSGLGLGLGLGLG